MAIDKEKAKFFGYGIEEGTVWISKDIDVSISAAFESPVNAETVEMITNEVNIIAERAIGPTTLEAGE